MATDTSPRASEAPAIDERNAAASVLMKRGIRLMDDAHPDAVADALHCFEQALAIRRAFPSDAAPVIRFGLAATLLNRADALARLGSPAQLRDALASYDAGLAVLADLPLASDPRFPRRMAIGHQNRGLALWRAAPDAIAPAVAAFERALEVLDAPAADAIPDRVLVQATIWTNLALVHASGAGDEAFALSRGAGRHALRLIAGIEQTDPDAAEAGLKARHVLCQTIAAHLAGALSAADVGTLAGEATDLADDGLTIVKAWEARGVDRFRGIGVDLFRFGCRVYAAFQPQFLNEFVLDAIDASRSSRAFVDSAELVAAVTEVRAFAPRSDR